LQPLRIAVEDLEARVGEKASQAELPERRPHRADQHGFGRVAVDREARDEESGGGVDLGAGRQVDQAGIGCGGAA
jgi:hypothetical protein